MTLSVQTLMFYVAEKPLLIKHLSYGDRGLLLLPSSTYAKMSGKTSLPYVYPHYILGRIVYTI